MSELEQQQAEEEEAIAAELGDDEDELDAGDVDDGEETSDEPEAEHPDELAIAAQRDAEQHLKKVSQTADRYVKRLVELLGPELGGYAGCTLCDGFPPGLVILEAVDDERRLNVKRQLGMETFEDLEADETEFKRCETCRGRGNVKTGSLKHNKETKPCRKCDGNGYIDLHPGAPGAAANGDAPAPVEQLEPGERPPYDQWGTPSWHADYGKTLEYRDVPVEHWRVNLPQAG